VAILAAIQPCVDALKGFITSPSGGVAQALMTFKTGYNLMTTDQVDEQLITSHYLIRILERWIVRGAGAKPPVEPANRVALSSHLAKLDANLHAMMDSEGLLEPLAGSLMAGPVIGQTGKLSSTPASTGGTPTTSTATGTAATSAGSSTTALAHIEWGSKHFGDENWWPVDFSFGGALGLQPALSLLKNPPPAAASGASTGAAGTSTPTTPSQVTSQYQAAFGWDLAGKLNIHSGPTAETALFAKGGQIRLLTNNGATVIDQGANSTLLIPLNGDANRMSWFWETGVDFKYYKKSLEVVHAEKGQLDPAFDIGISYRLDNRFSQKAGVVGFDSPDRRLVFRFMINGVKIFDRRPDTTTSKPYALSFGVEHERGFGANPVPSGTQLIIRGDINLIKLINPAQGQ
jgi:hypothetical protein